MKHDFINLNTGSHRDKKITTMGEKIQLSHPAGKHAVKMDKGKYEIISDAIIRCLQTRPLTHKEMAEAVFEDFRNNSIQFEGSVEWYMESVKLDLEAHKIIERIKENSKLKFRLISR